MYELMKTVINQQDLLNQHHSVEGLIIRQEVPDDHRETEELVREAFFNRYKPGCDEHYLMHRLRQAPDFLPWHSLVAEYDGAVVGQVMLSPAAIMQDSQAAIPLLTLGPVCVLPALVGRGVGSALMRAAIAIASHHGARAILLMGDPGYYQRFGFVPAARFHIRLPEAGSQDAPFFMALPMYQGALDHAAGLFQLSPVFAGYTEGFDAYDSSFPHRRKLRLPGQLI